MTNTIKIKCIQYLQPEACDTWHQGSYPHCEPPFPRFTLHPPSSNDRDVNWRIEVYLLAFHKILTRFQFRIETRLKSYFIILSIIIFVSSESCNGFWKIEDACNPGLNHVHVTLYNNPHSTLDYQILFSYKTYQSAKYFYGR